MYHHWNPYSDEVKNIPWIYWVLSFNFLQVKHKHNWEGTLLPHAELISQIANPEAFMVYYKHKKKQAKAKEVGAGGEYYTDTFEGIEGAGSANSHFDPEKGLVNDKGTVIIPREQYEEMLGMDGVAISW